MQTVKNLWLKIETKKNWNESWKNVAQGIFGSDRIGSTDRPKVGIVFCRQLTLIGACNSPETGDEQKLESFPRFISFVKDFSLGISVVLHCRSTEIPEREREGAAVMPALPHELRHCHCHYHQRIGRIDSQSGCQSAFRERSLQSALVMGSWQMFNICTPVFYHFLPRLVYIL